MGEKGLCKLNEKITKGEMSVNSSNKTVSKLSRNTQYLERYLWLAFTASYVPK
jgi:hypothetical protein